VVLLSIRHHQELSFGFARLWPAAAPSDDR
jgi:hypothetical protein